MFFFIPLSKVIPITQAISFYLIEFMFQKIVLFIIGYFC